MGSILRAWQPVRPSFKGGYASNASESIVPEQWSGLVAAYCASLGPTGLTSRDVSGHGHHGALFGPFLPSELWAREPGGLNMGMVFHFTSPDGTRRIICGNAVSTPFPAFVDKTFCAWVRNDVVAGVETVLSFGADLPFFGFGVGKIAMNGGVIGNTIVVAGEWNHIAMTSGPSGTVAYLNGRVDGTAARNSTPLANQLQIGWSIGNNQLEGAMEDIRIYNRALSAAAMLEIYELGPAGMFIPEPEVVGQAVAAAAPTLPPAYGVDPVFGTLPPAYGVVASGTLPPAYPPLP